MSTKPSVKTVAILLNFFANFIRCPFVNKVDKMERNGVKYGKIKRNRKYKIDLNPNDLYENSN